MRKAKFKKNKRHKLVLVIVATILCVFMLSHYFVSTVSNSIASYAEAKVKKENIILIKKAFEQNTGFEKNVDNLIQVVKNSKDEIVEVDFDMDECFTFLKAIRNTINEEVSKYNYLGYRVDIPVGVLANSPIFFNIGPKIPVKVEIMDVALGNVRTEVESFGINNALIKIYVDLTLYASIMFPKEVKETSTTYETLISSKIIAGTVPSFLGGYLNSKSKSINLPIDE